MSWGFSIETLMNEVSNIIATGAPNAVVAPHELGGAGLYSNARGPRYVWVPRVARGEEPVAKRAVDMPRALAAIKDGVDIYCIGLSFAQCAALRQNLAKALHDAAMADLTIVGGEWVGPRANLNQDGETFILAVSIPTLIIDAWVDLATLDDPTVTTHVLAEVEGELEKTDDVDEAGEPAFTVLTE